MYIYFDQGTHLKIEIYLEWHAVFFTLINKENKAFTPNKDHDHLKLESLDALQNGTSMMTD